MIFQKFPNGPWTPIYSSSTFEMALQIFFSKIRLVMKVNVRMMATKMAKSSDPGASILEGSANHWLGAEWRKADWEHYSLWHSLSACVLVLLSLILLPMSCEIGDGNSNVKNMMLGLGKTFCIAPFIQRVLSLWTINIISKWGPNANAW